MLCRPVCLSCQPVTQEPSSTQEKNPVRLPPVTVSETKPSTEELREDLPFGPNQQPEWTTRRRFATTRAFMSARRGNWNSNSGGRGSFRARERPSTCSNPKLALASLIGSRLISTKTFLSKAARFEHQGNQFEARWAFADWGKIPLNPTFYGRCW